MAGTQLHVTLESSEGVQTSTLEAKLYKNALSCNVEMHTAVNCSTTSVPAMLVKLILFLTTSICACLVGIHRC